MARGIYPGARAPGIDPGARAPGPPRPGPGLAGRSAPNRGVRARGPSWRRLGSAGRSVSGPGAGHPGPTVCGDGRLLSLRSCGGCRAASQVRRRPAGPRLLAGSGGGQAEVGASGLAGPVDQAVRGHDEVVPQLGVERRVESQLVQGGAHVAQPRVPLRLPDGEVRVAHAQPRMATPLVVGAGAAPVLDEEQAQVLLGRPEILARIYRPELRVSGNALVERMHQAPEGLLAADRFVEAGRFCSRVHTGVQGTGPRRLRARLRPQLLRVIVTRRTQFWPSIVGPAVLYAACTKDLLVLCMSHTNQHNVNFTDSDSR